MKLKTLFKNIASQIEYLPKNHHYTPTENLIAFTGFLRLVVAPFQHSAFFLFFCSASAIIIHYHLTKENNL